MPRGTVGLELLRLENERLWEEQWAEEVRRMELEEEEEVKKKEEEKKKKKGGGGEAKGDAGGGDGVLGGKEEEEDEGFTLGVRDRFPAIVCLISPCKRASRDKTNAKPRAGARANGRVGWANGRGKGFRQTTCRPKGWLNFAIVWGCRATPGDTFNQELTLLPPHAAAPPIFSNLHSPIIRSLKSLCLTQMRCPTLVVSQHRRGCHQYDDTHATVI